jgi:hypothetical protein
MNKLPVLQLKKNIGFVIILLVSACHMSMSQSFTESVYPDSVNKGRLYVVAGAGTAIYAGGLSYLGFVWYRDQERVPFHLYNDGKGYLQMDKLGHGYVAYQQSLMAYRALRWAGVDHKKSLIWGGSAGFLFQLPIEIFDGLYEGWGFSWWDVAANAAGSAIFTAQQAFLKDQPVLIKFSYSPSGYPKYHHILGTNELESFFLDYNGHTYWLSANLGSLSGKDFFPPWLNVAFGYSANGMIFEFDNPEFYRGEPFPHLERYRQFFFSLDVDFTRIPTQKRWLRSVFSALNMLKVPFPAVEINRVDGVKMRPFYF